MGSILPSLLEGWVFKIGVPYDVASGGGGHGRTGPISLRADVVADSFCC